MKMKKFIAPDMRQALHLVRSTFGPDAVIISDRKIPNGIEVTAAIDYDETLAGMIATENKPVVQEQPYFSSSNTEDFSVQSMKSEINALKDLIMHQLAGFAWNNSQQLQPLQIQLAKRLTEVGIAPKLVREILSEISSTGEMETLWQQATTRLAQKILIADSDIIDEQGIFALVGPTGVGKTTTIAKLAARYVLRNGPNGLGLITSDCYRIAAQDQLRTYGNILNVPVRSVESIETLKSALYDLREKRLILIDTVGMSQRDTRLPNQMELLQEQGKNIRCLLVLPCTVQKYVCREIISAYQTLSLCGVALTKLDESSHLGEILSILIQNSLPIAYTSSGQRVPEDLQLARPETLVSQTLEIGSKYYQIPNDELLAHVFAEGVTDAV